MPSDPVAAAIAECHADPSMGQWNSSHDIGGCLTSCRRFALALEQRNVKYEIRRYHALPGWRTHVQHVTVVDGLVYDWIAPQFRPGCDWPDVRTLAQFEAEFGKPDECCPRCGSTGDLDPGLRKQPLAQHRCPGPDERIHNDRAAHVIAGLPRSQRRALERRLHANARRAGLHPR